jgi:hypothetical protein
MALDVNVVAISAEGDLQSTKLIRLIPYHAIKEIQYED